MTAAIRPATSALYSDKVGRVFRFVEERLDEDLDPATLARVGCVSLYHFHRVFRGVTGETLAGYVRRLRLERAARRLRATGARVTDLALGAGFGSHEAFTRAFRDHFGVSPSEYRGQGGRAGEALTPPDTVEVGWLPAMPVARVRRVGPYEGSGEAFARLFSWAGANGVPTAGPVLGVCLDDPEVTPDDRLRFDACLATPKVPAIGEVRPGVIPEGWYARTVHAGPYEGLPAAYSALVGGWAAGTDHELADEACVEVYLNDPGQVTPADLRTEIRVRLLR